MTVINADELLKRHMDSELKIISDDGVQSISFKDFYEAVAQKLRDEYPGMLYEGEGQ